MKKLIYVLLIFYVSACQRPAHQPEDIREPQYFFHWDSAKGVGSCLNKHGVQGYNPKFIGPCGDLRGYTFQLPTLDGVDLRGSMLDGINLSGFSLNGANLKGVKARGTNFSKSEMNGTKLMYGSFEGSSFDGAELDGADFHHARLSGTGLDRSSLMGADFSLADLGGANLPENLSTSNMKGSVFTYGTSLPFSDKIAQDRGMTESNQKHLEKRHKKGKQMLHPPRIPSNIQDEAVQKAFPSEKSQ